MKIKMIDHLHIQNFRLFRDLRIDKIGQVNLIAGKNNTGKTALLEAIALLSASNDRDLLRNTVSISILSRGDEDASDRLATLFFNPKNDCKINDTIFKKEQMSIDMSARQWVNNQFVSVSFENDDKLNGSLWDNIALTPEEDEAIEVLQVVESEIKKLHVNGGKAKVLINGDAKPIPLKNLGSGANRLLSVGLALVNAKNKVLLIDEFEIGLHHDIQKKLWEIIFKYAKKWNIQVFVTTHSQDTMLSFYKVADNHQDMANYFKLARMKDNQIKAINFDHEEMETAFLSNIEIR